MLGWKPTLWAKEVSKLTATEITSILNDTLRCFFHFSPGSVSMEG
jgi:hypothetical protein